MRTLGFILLLPLCALAERSAMDTSGVGLGDGYDIGDSLGGFRINSFTVLTVDSMPYEIGAKPWESLTDWDVYVLTADINWAPSGNSSPAIKYVRDGSSNAPKRIILDGQDNFLTLLHDTGSGLANTDDGMITMNGIGGGPSTTGGVSDSIITKNLKIVHNLNDRFHGEDKTVAFENWSWGDWINIDVYINRAHDSVSTAYSVGGLAFFSANGAANDNEFGAFQMYFDDVHIWNYSTAFYRRDRVFASGMHLGGVHRKDSMVALFSFTDVDTGWYQYIVKNSTIHITPHFGFFAHGSLSMHDNICSTFMRNDYYEFFDGGTSPTMTKRAANAYTFPDASFPADGEWPNLDSGMAYGASGSGLGWSQFWTSSNPYAFALSDGIEGTAGLGPGSKIYNNTMVPHIDSGINRGQGNRAFDIEHPFGTADEPVLVHDNTIEVRHGRNGDFSSGSVWGARVRWGGEHFQFYNNTITGYIDSRPGDGVTSEDSIPSGVGSKVWGIRLTAGNISGSGVADSFSFYNNTIVIEYYEDSTFGIGGTNVDDMGFALNNIRTNAEHNGSIFVFGNHYTTKELGLQAGGVNTDGGMQNLVIHDDTIVRGSPYDTAGWKSIVGGYPDGFADSNNTFLDLVYQGGATEAQKTLTESGQDWWRFARTGKVLVVGTGTPPDVGVAQCSVTITNAFSQALFTNIEVDSPGVFTGIIYYERQGTLADSTGYNDHTFFARKGADVSASVDSTIDADNNLVVLTLTSTAGTFDTTGWAGSVPILENLALDAVGNQTITEGNNLTFTVTANGGVLPYVFTFNELDPLPGNAATLNSATGAFAWLSAIGDAGAYDLEFIVTDAVSAVDRDTITVTVNEPAAQAGGGNIAKVKKSD